MSVFICVFSPSLKIITALFDERFVFRVYLDASHEYMVSVVDFSSKNLCVLVHNSSPISNDDDDDVVGIVTHMHRTQTFAASCAKNHVRSAEKRHEHIPISLFSV